MRSVLGQDLCLGPILIIWALIVSRTQSYRDAGGYWRLLDSAYKRLSEMPLFLSTIVAPQVVKLFSREVGEFVRHAGRMLDGYSGNVTR